ncbi:MAG: hypothetical protein Q8N99_05305 [Nanoarchaeota archaeon]|nr:hypothetical protein [Nanoarchaeota archaeon]
MTSGKKQYFRIRTESEIKELNQTSASHQRDLVQRIDGLDPRMDALIIKFDDPDEAIIPDRFFYDPRTRERLTGVEASRKAYKHGLAISLPQPRTLKETYASKAIPLELRERAFRRLQRMRQQDIKFIGYSWIPVFGNDKEKRVVNLDTSIRGSKRFSYAENYSVYKGPKGIEKFGIEVVNVYDDAEIVRKQGAFAIVLVPAESEKTPRYRFKLVHVPILPNNPSHELNYNLATVMSLRSEVTFRDDDEAYVGRTPHDIFIGLEYKFRQSREENPVLRFSPLDVAGYLGIVKQQLTEKHNQTPLQYNPFALPSKHWARFSVKCDSNVLVYDPSLSSKDKLRHLHLAEKCILYARAIGHFGHDDISYWDPTRDGIFKNYDWSIGGKE